VQPAHVPAVTVQRDKESSWNGEYSSVLKYGRVTITLGHPSYNLLFQDIMENLGKSRSGRHLTEKVAITEKRSSNSRESF